MLDENEDNIKEARTVAQAFYGAYGQELGLKDAPFVTVGIEGGPGYSYDPAHNVLFITPFSHADFDTQKIFAKATESDQAHQLYNSLLFNFFTAHQLMYLVYDRLPVTSTSTYEKYKRINTLTWLFMKEHNLFPANQEQQLEMLHHLEAYLAARFPKVSKRELPIAQLDVVDNGSYWYVTSVSLKESRRLADIAGSQRSFIASITQSTGNLGAATN